MHVPVWEDVVDGRVAEDCKSDIIDLDAGRVYEGQRWPNDATSTWPPGPSRRLPILRSCSGSHDRVAAVPARPPVYCT